MSNGASGAKDIRHQNHGEVNVNDERRYFSTSILLVSRAAKENETAHDERSLFRDVALAYFTSIESPVLRQNLSKMCHLVAAAPIIRVCMVHLCLGAYPEH